MNATDSTVITPDFVLNLIKYCGIFGGVIVAAITIIAVFTVNRVGEDAVKPVIHVVTQGDALRMLTVIFIVGSTTGLVLLGKIDGGHGATILSGVAGYVLGSGARPKPGANVKQANANSTT